MISGWRAVFWFSHILFVLVNYRKLFGNSNTVVPSSHSTPILILRWIFTFIFSDNISYPKRILRQKCFENTTTQFFKCVRQLWLEKSTPILVSTTGFHQHATDERFPKLALDRPEVIISTNDSLRFCNIVVVYLITTCDDCRLRAFGWLLCKQGGRIVFNKQRRKCFPHKKCFPESYLAQRLKEINFLLTIETSKLEGSTDAPRGSWT